MNDKMPERWVRFTEYTVLTLFINGEKIDLARFLVEM